MHHLITNKYIKCNILEIAENKAEGNVELHIFQGLPKADKMELIIQKGTELGVNEFIPVAFKRSIFFWSYSTFWSNNNSYFVFFFFIL